MFMNAISPGKKLMKKPKKEKKRPVLSYIPKFLGKLFHNSLKNQLYGKSQKWFKFVHIVCIVFQ